MKKVKDPFKNIIAEHANSVNIIEAIFHALPLDERLNVIRELEEAETRGIDPDNPRWYDLLLKLPDDQHFWK
jgi:hypothetical protein